MTTKAKRKGGQHTTPEPGEKRPPVPPAPPMKGATKGCDCAKKVDQALEAQGVRLIRKIQIDFSTKTTGLTPPLLMVEKFKPSRKAAPSVVCSFCPFCGNKYPD